MNNQVLFIIQAAFIFFFIWWLLSKRGRLPNPTVLDLNKDLKIQKEIHFVEKQDAAQAEKQNLFHMQNKRASKFLPDPSMTLEQAKCLNVIFMWNGHSWDAYEVFGLPAGSSIEIVKVRYEELITKSDEGQKQFLYLAYSSIVEKSKKSI